jgi:hypothetical protein
MKELGHIYLSWRKGPGSRRHIVGVLKRNATEGVRFAYLKEGVNKARADEFSPYTEFPDTEKEYKENVIEVFGKRIMKSERSDISDFYDFWEVDPKYKDDIFYLLAHTQGLNPADNFEFLAEYNPTKNLRFLTDLAGLTTFKLPVGSLEAGDKLTYKPEPTNAFDKDAVLVLKDQTPVGYIKKIHCKVFQKRKGRPFQLTVKAVENNGFVKKVFVQVAS